MTTDIVPFGKYKGRPVVDLVADRSYCDWLAAQPWFRERYAPVYNVIINGTAGQPQDSPEHNKMQARYLDHDACLTLARLWLVGPETLRTRWDKQQDEKLTPRQRANLQVEPFGAYVLDLAFEEQGWDLLIKARTELPVTEVAEPGPCECYCEPGRCGQRMVTRSRFDKSHGPDKPYGKMHYWDETLPVTADAAEWSKCHEYGGRRTRHCAEDCPATWTTPTDRYGCSSSLTAYEKALDGRGGDAHFGVELKPTIGDDYPSILRAVVKRMQMGQSRGTLRLGKVLVLADEVQTEGVELDAVKRIYRTQGVTLLTTAELPLASPDWQCRCSPCRAAR